MTSEIAVVNANGIALAADSAVTIVDSQDDKDAKVYNSANKLFALSKFEPVAIMVYGQGAIADVPWEVIIKEFRASLHDTHFDTLSEYVEKFWDYMRLQSDDSFTRNARDKAITDRLSDLFKNFKKEHAERFKGIIDNIDMDSSRKNDDDIRSILDYEVDKFLGTLENQVNSHAIYEGLESVSARDIVDKYKGLFDGAIAKAFKGAENMLLTHPQIIQLYIIIAEILRRKVLRKLSGGVVFAGYGRSEIYPRISNYEVGIFVNDVLQIQYIPELSNIDKDLFRPDIYPFAQAEMVKSFVNGISDMTEQNMREAFGQISSSWHQEILEVLLSSEISVNDQLEKSLNDALSTKQNELIKCLDSSMDKSIKPIAEMLGHLQKDELAEMAESLVNLTVFKRKVSSEKESVGGPIDVAVISKGDGFIWVKRKHYFKPELNRSFFDNYLNDRRDGK